MQYTGCMGNKAQINYEKNFGELILEGEQTGPVMIKLIQETFAMNNQLSTQYGEVHVLVDISKMGPLPAFTQNVIIKGLETGSFDKMAVVGANKDNQPLIDHMVSASGKNARVKYFANRQEAEAWLGA